MAVVNFFMDSGAAGTSDLNAGIGGSGSSATTPGTNDYTSTGGNFDGTSVFTPTDGSTPASFIAVGDYVSLYNTGDTACRCLAKVTVVAAGVNGAVTIDTTIKYGTVPTVNSGSRALRHGGSWASLGIVAANACMNTGTAPQSTQVNIKVNASAYANTTNGRTLGMLGTATVAMIWSGYKSTINDQDTNLLAVALTDIPSITWTTQTLTLGGHTTLRNVAVTTASTSATAINSTATTNTISNCQVTNTGANAASTALNLAGASNAVIGTYIRSTTTATKSLAMANANTLCAGCYVAGGVTGILCSSGVSNILNTVVDSPATDAVSTAVSTNIYGLTAYAGSATGNGINFTTVTVSVVMDSYFEGFTGGSKAAINNTSGTNTDIIRVIGCAYFNNTATVSGLGDYPEFFSAGTLASSGLNTPGSQDFTPKTVLQGVGFPAHMPTFSPTSYPTPGAMDAQSGGTTFVGSPFPG